MKRNDYVINLIEFSKELNGETIKVVKNSVGLVVGIDDIIANILFIGKNVLIDTKVTNLMIIDLKQTGDEYPYKVCNVCHILKPVTEFEYNQNNIKRKVRRPSCKNCRKIIDGEPLIKAEKARMEEIKPKIIFKCPICGKTSIPGVTANLVIDHNHETGEAREWICDSCNTGLGRFKDDPKILKTAIDYLNKHESKD